MLILAVFTLKVATKVISVRRMFLVCSPRVAYSAAMTRSEVAENPTAFFKLNVATISTSATVD
jgi:hypothetical protein